MLWLSRRIHRLDRHTIKKEGSVCKKHMQHLQHEMPKVEQHMESWGKGKFKIFLFFKLRKAIKH